MAGGLSWRSFSQYLAIGPGSDLLDSEVHNARSCERQAKFKDVEIVKKSNQTEGRREFLKKAAYAAPVILTLKADASFAGIGSHSASSSSNDDDQGENNNDQ